MRLNYKHTLYACFIGYITQAIVGNLPTLLFTIFQNQFNISLERITLLLTMGFCIQIVVDILASKFVDIFGYRISLTLANLCCIGGLLSIGFLPFYIDPFIGLSIGIVLNSIGGGFIEVMVSPIVEALPGDEKTSAMSILHSFYCWGYMGVVLLSTLFFTIIGITYWKYLLILWAIVPIFNTFFFINVPIKALVEKSEQIPIKKLLSLKVFWLLFVLMICSGAAEQAMSKWSSLFSELGLGVSKTLGDLLGPCAFAFFMGLTRLFYSKKGHNIDLKKLIFYSSILCIFSYLLVSLSPIPIISLFGCALTGLSIGVLWPVTLSLSAKTYPSGGNTMFGLLALGGDIGCAAGPSIVGFVSNALISSNKLHIQRFFTGENITQVALKAGLFIAIIFPVLILFNIYFLKNTDTKDHIDQDKIKAENLLQ
ncbi:MFS transporter [Clostridium sp. SHJSY1]|uniref:MFS transporter n=1 Tax=Clostridium sp. SHJSY1 TaxID=2942483 RepID=UPI00287568F9|nr:MFS transporter [Clostridium sp. SHJSY1]MDS0524712.1 MFS transporter [Clostridium sp. SHJSY1]